MTLNDHFGRSEAPRTAAISRAAFIVFAVFVVASDHPGLPLATPQERGHGSPETGARAEELFRGALASDAQGRDSARRQLQDAMELWVQMGEPQLAAAAALEIGDRAKERRGYPDALSYYRLALKVESLPGLYRAKALTAIARLYADLYESELSIRYFNLALDQAQSINDTPMQLIALTGMAGLYHRLGDKAKALSHVDRAQRLNTEARADGDSALLYLVGQMRLEEGAVKQARSAFDAALAIYERTGNTDGEARVLCSISALSLRSSQKQEAVEQARRAAQLTDGDATPANGRAAKVGVTDTQWRATLSCARAERAIGDNENAVKSYKKSIHQLTKLWHTVYLLTEASAIAFREETQPAYRELVDLLMKKGKVKEAFGFADEAKGRALETETAARGFQPGGKKVDQAPIQQELSRYIADRRQLLRSPQSGPAKKRKLQQEVEEAESTIQEAQVDAEMRSSVPTFSAPVAEELKERMARDDSALAEFFLGEERSFVWLITPDDVRFETLPARDQIEKAVGQYLNRLAATPSPLHIDTDLASLRTQGEELFTRLFGRLSTHIERTHRLILVPDGILHYLPFEALVHDGHYMVEDHVISYSPSSSMLELLQDSKRSVESGDSMELLAVGDPVLGPKSKPGGNRWRGESAQIFRGRTYLLAELPRTKNEINDIANLFPPHRRKVLIGMDGTEAAFKNERLRRYRLLHLATHCVVEEQSPFRSAVVLTPDRGLIEDGFLEVSEIARLDLDCDLVVVSACQTGRGQLLAGEGVVGLSRAFLRAGARSVVVSFWKVSDIATGLLMKNFYRNMVDGLNSAAALRNSKVEMLKSGQPARHPHYWSSFVMVGKP